MYTSSTINNKNRRDTAIIWEQIQPVQQLITSFTYDYEPNTYYNVIHHCHRKFWCINEYNLSFSGS